MRAWLYCRVANGWDSDASDHLALQKTELEHFCTEHNLTIVGTSMTTGSGENELETLVQNGIAQDSFDVLLTVSASRLSRDIRTALHVSRELFQCGKGLCLVKENICSLTTAGEVPLQLNDGSGCVLLFHVGVYVGGHLDRGMAQEILCCFQVNAHPVEIGRVAVPLRYNNDKQKKPLFSRGLSVCRLLFNSFSKLKIDENYKEKRRLFY